MSLKTTIQKLIAKLGRLPMISSIIRRDSVRRKIEKIPGGNLLYGSGWDRIHPFDRYHGTDTSGVVTAKKLPTNEAARVHAIDYAGSQPHVLRLALAQLPPLDSYTFLDLGCGKGRALLVASEFSFRDIIGVELSSPLAQITKRNAAIISRRFPRRTPVGIAVGDASNYPLPSGNLVIFLYNPFRAELIANVVAGVEAALAAESRSIYVIYYNPIAGHCFDASPHLCRRFAKMLPYAERELGYGPDQEDPVVIWQGGTAPRPTDVNANAKILVTNESRVQIGSATEQQPVFS
jgi:SAM-dependent methyltransferase